MTDKSVVQRHIKMPPVIDEAVNALAQKENITITQAYLDLAKAAIAIGSIEEVKAFALVASKFPTIAPFIRDINNLAEHFKSAPQKTDV